ncbi:MAG: hypothetical protein FD168_1719 [Desulfobulbaceae bacterium]|nr:MAG: hypothetical protein FD168_1719 [Desulfobulbaceae bacterium]
MTTQTTVLKIGVSCSEKQLSSWSFLRTWRELFFDMIYLVSKGKAWNSTQKKKEKPEPPGIRGFGLNLWCLERESNPHGRRAHEILSLGCLPVPPSRHEAVLTTALFCLSIGKSRDIPETSLTNLPVPLNLQLRRLPLTQSRRWIANHAIYFLPTTLNCYRIPFAD